MGWLHVQIQVADHDEILRVESGKFKRHLARLFYEKNGTRWLIQSQYTNALRCIQAKAEYEGQTIPLSFRVAWHDGDIYCDLSNDKWQCLKISEQNWEILNHIPSPIFVRYNQTAQVGARYTL